MSVEVEVRLTASWSAIPVNRVSVNMRHGRGSGATFTINKASTVDRLLLRVGRIVRITFTEGANVSRFGGVITRPGFRGNGTGGFSMTVECAELAEAAKQRFIFDRLYPQALETVTEAGLSASADTYISGITGQEDTNFDTTDEEHLIVDLDATAGVRRTLLMFNLAGIPTSNRISKAELSLRCTESDPTFGPHEMNLFVHRVTNPWLEGQGRWWATSGGSSRARASTTSSAPRRR